MSDHLSDTPQDHDLERLLALLADRATTPLTIEEERELERLMGQVHDAPEIAASFDAVEGALVESQHATREPLPAALRARLAAQGRALVSGGAIEADAPAPIPIARQLTGPTPGDASRSRGARPILSNLGWLVAAAAIVLAAAAWWPTGATEDLPPTASDRRTALVRDDASAISLVLDPSGDPSAQEVVADIVWSTARQEGYLRVRGLAINDPSREQYQLWIYDSSRDDRYPVDAGVFDVAMASIDPVTRDVVIPINPKLAVGRAQMFAVTIEPPGGVVVPSGERILLRAVVATGLG
jgi:hypothetical protein